MSTFIDILAASGALTWFGTVLVVAFLILDHVHHRRKARREDRSVQADLRALRGLEDPEKAGALIDALKSSSEGEAA